MPRKPGRDYESVPVYALKAKNGQKAEKEIWSEFARLHGWSRSELIRLAVNHARTCPLFLPSNQQSESINEG
jgi:hypothetical protein